MAKSSLVRVPVQSIVVRRGEKNVTPEIGKPFEFTKEEIDDLDVLKPKPFRDLIVEEAPEPAEAPAPAPASTKAAAKTAAKTGDAADL